MADLYAPRERSQWTKGKTPIVSQYMQEHTKLMTEIAGRGFLRLPGYAYNAEDNLEMATKAGLSELNFKILKETIDLELKQTGIDYSLAVRNAMMAWEMEKQSLLTAWAGEYEGIKLEMSLNEETLDRIAIEVSLRGAILTESKTAIELQMEADKKALAELDASTAPYDIQLANAKLLTAQRKLALIPILQEIIVKEQSLLTEEQAKAAAYTALMTAEQQVVLKKETLVPYVNELASDTEGLTQDINNIEIPVEKAIAGEKLNQSNIAVQKAGYQVQEETIVIATANKELALKDEERVLQVTKFTDNQKLITDEIGLTTTYQNDMMADFNTIIQGEKDTNATVIANRTADHTIRNKTALNSATTMQGEDRSIAARYSAEEINEMQEKANIEVSSTITASLKHLIGQ